MPSAGHTYYWVQAPDSPDQGVWGSRGSQSGAASNAIGRLALLPPHGGLGTDLPFQLITLRRVGNANHAVYALRQRKASQVSHTMFCDNDAGTTARHSHRPAQRGHNTTVAAGHGGQGDDGGATLAG